MKTKSKLRRWLSIGAVSCAGLLIASGCGSNAETAEGERTSAIDAYLGTDFFGDFDSDSIEQDFAAQQREAEEAIAACMKREGFEYTPSDNSASVGFVLEGDLEYGTPEWTEKYGFGITTQRFGQSEVGPELVGYDDSAFANDDEFVDPNQEYIESLDQAGQDAYYAALFGDQDGFGTAESFEEEGIQEVESYEPSGCQGEALGSGPTDFFAFFDEFGDELDELLTDVEADPKFVSKLDDVQACVTEAGYELPAGWPNRVQDSRESAYQKELEEIEALVGGPDQFDDIDFDSMSEEELQSMFADGPPARDFSPEAKALLSELQNKEISTAVATDKCGGGPLELTELFQELLADYEDRFIETNRDKLDSFKANQEASQ